jgi:hypothetical protein
MLARPGFAFERGEAQSGCDDFGLKQEVAQGGADAQERNSGGKSGLPEYGKARRAQVRNLVTRE